MENKEISHANTLHIDSILSGNSLLFGSRYSREDQVKFVEDSLDPYIKYIRGPGTEP